MHKTNSSNSSSPVLQSTPLPTIVPTPQPPDTTTCNSEVPELLSGYEHFLPPLVSLPEREADTESPAAVRTRSSNSQDSNPEGSFIGLVSIDATKVCNDRERIEEAKQVLPPLEEDEMIQPSRQLEVEERPGYARKERKKRSEQRLKSRADFEARLRAEEKREEAEPDDRKGKGKVRSSERRESEDTVIPSRANYHPRRSIMRRPLSSNIWSEEQFIDETREAFFVLITYIFDPAEDIQSLKGSYVWERIERGLSTLDPSFLNSELGTKIRECYLHFFPERLALFLKNKNRGDERCERLRVFLECLKADESLAAKFVSEAIVKAIESNPTLIERPALDSREDFSREDFAVEMSNAHMHEMAIILTTLTTSHGRALIKADLDYQKNHAPKSGYSIVHAIHTVLAQEDRAIASTSDASSNAPKISEGGGVLMLKELCQARVANEIGLLLKVLIKVYCQFGMCIEAETKQPLQFHTYYSAVGASITKMLEGIVNEESIFEYILLRVSTKVAELSTLLTEEEKQYLVCRLSDWVITPEFIDYPKFVSSPTRHQQLWTMLHTTLLPQTLVAQEIDLKALNVKQLFKLCQQAARYLRSGGVRNIRENVNRALEVHEELCARMLKTKNGPRIAKAINQYVAFVGDCLATNSENSNRIREFLVKIVQELSQSCKLKELDSLSIESIFAIRGALDWIAKSDKSAVSKLIPVSEWIAAHMKRVKNELRSIKDQFSGLIRKVRNDHCQNWEESMRLLNELYDMWRSARNSVKHYQYVLPIGALFEFDKKDFKRYGVLVWKKHVAQIEDNLSHLTECLKEKIQNYDAPFNDMLRRKFASDYEKQGADFFSIESIEQEVQEIYKDLDKPNRLFSALKISTRFIKDNVEFQATMMRAQFATKRCLEQIRKCLSGELSNSELGGSINTFITIMLRLLPQNSMFDSTAQRMIQSGETGLIKEIVIELLKLPEEKMEKAIESFDLVALVAFKGTLDQIKAQQREPFLFVEDGRRKLALASNWIGLNLEKLLPILSEAVDNFVFSIERARLASGDLVKEQIATDVLKRYQNVFGKVELLELDAVFKLRALILIEEEVEHSILIQLNRFANAHESLSKLIRDHFSSEDAAILQQFKWVERAV